MKENLKLFLAFLLLIISGALFIPLEGMYTLAGTITLSCSIVLFGKYIEN
jgi:Tfp pilus assembly protein PilZ